MKPFSDLENKLLPLVKSGKGRRKPKLLGIANSSLKNTV